MSDNNTQENVAGAAGALTGAASGMGASTVAISSLGVVPGLSGAGITSGLATVGGSMLGGIAVASAGVGVLAFAGYFGGKIALRKYRDRKNLPCRLEINR